MTSWLYYIFLLMAGLISFVWVQNDSINRYSLQLTAVLILVFFLVSKLKATHKNEKIISSILFTMVTLLLVLTSGGLTSPLFFLVYFLLFGLSLAVSPLSSLLLSGVMILLFLLLDKSALDNLLPLFSLLLITPLSVFFGSQYLQNIKLKGKVNQLGQQEKQSRMSITADETDILLWLSLNFKHSISSILDSLSRVLEKPGLSFSQKQELVKAIKTGKKILRLGEMLKDKVDKETEK